MGVVTDMAGECGLGVVVQANSYTARDGGPEETWLSEGTEDTTLCTVLHYNKLESLSAIWLTDYTCLLYVHVTLYMHLTSMQNVVNSNPA